MSAKPRQRSGKGASGCVGVVCGPVHGDVEGHVGQIFAKLALEPAADDHRRVLAVLTYLRST